MSLLWGVTDPGVITACSPAVTPVRMPALCCIPGAGPHHGDGAGFDSAAKEEKNSRQGQIHMPAVPFAGLQKPTLSWEDVGFINGTLLQRFYEP